MINRDDIMTEYMVDDDGIQVRCTLHIQSIAEPRVSESMLAQIEEDDMEGLVGEVAKTLKDGIMTKLYGDLKKPIDEMLVFLKRYEPEQPRGNADYARYLSEKTLHSAFYERMLLELSGLNAISETSEVKEVKE